MSTTIHPPAAKLHLKLRYSADSGVTFKYLEDDPDTDSTTYNDTVISTPPNIGDYNYGDHRQGVNLYKQAFPAVKVAIEYESENPGITLAGSKLKEKKYGSRLKVNADLLPLKIGDMYSERVLDYLERFLYADIKQIGFFDPDSQFDGFVEPLAGAPMVPVVNDSGIGHTKENGYHYFTVSVKSTDLYKTNIPLVRNYVWAS